MQNDNVKFKAKTSLIIIAIAFFLIGVVYLCGIRFIYNTHDTPDYKNQKRGYIATCQHLGVLIENINFEYTIFEYSCDWI